jgi:hypothetical protein
MKNIYKAILPDYVRTFIWHRIFDIRFLLSSPMIFLKRIYRGYIYKNNWSKDTSIVNSYKSNLPFSSFKDIEFFLENNELKFSQGAHALYINDRNTIETLCPGLVECIPHSFGLKIIKSKMISPDGTPYYSGLDAAPSSTKISMKIVGGVMEKSVISNVLSEYNVAPRTYKLIKIISGKNSLYAMCVEEINGKIVHGDLGEKFLSRFYDILKSENIYIIGGVNSGDFKLPSFNENIIVNNKGTYYVDIQNFGFDNPDERVLLLGDRINKVTHFGASTLFRKNKYSYQSIPSLNIGGKRDSLFRVNFIDNFLSENSISLDGVNIMDVGCNLGLFIQYSLSKNANWCIGLDTPKIAEVSRKYLYELGLLSFDVFGVDLKSDISYLFDSIKFKVIFYMSIEGHIGFPDWLKSVKFEYILYEGHQDENIMQIKNKIKKSFLDVNIIAETITQDGDSRARPLLLCKNSNYA